MPAALPVFIDQQDRAALTHLARQAGLPLPTLLRQYGHHAVAKHVFEGAQLSSASAPTPDKIISSRPDPPLISNSKANKASRSEDPLQVFTAIASAFCRHPLTLRR